MPNASNADSSAKKSTKSSGARALKNLRIALGQINTRVGDLSGNVERIAAVYEIAEDAGCDVALFPELVLPGYPPEDLLIRPGFLEDNVEALTEIADSTKRCVAVLGYADDEEADDYVGGIRSANAVALCCDGRVVGKYLKQKLPNYGPFDEARHFDSGVPSQPLWEIGGCTVGISICEDIWYPDGPPVSQAQRGAEVLLNVNASPFHASKMDTRKTLLQERFEQTKTPIVYLNLVGAQDELVFDGGSIVVDHRGEIAVQGSQFVEQVMIFDLEVPNSAKPPEVRPVHISSAPFDRPPLENSRLSAQGHAAGILVGASVAPLLGPDEEVWEALVLGVRDYFLKNGFTDAVIGLSGGIDSSVVAVIAADALGAENVHGVSMPSRYSSDHSKSDAADLAERLGIEFMTIPIEETFAAITDTLEPQFVKTKPDLTEENLQARIRGLILMALSNKFGWLVLATGNKSEAAVGFCTLYGDTNGAMSVIKDVYKTRLYELARWRNERSFVLSESILTKPPSAELRENQTDDQSLPPYDELDAILAGYVDSDLTIEDLIEAGHSPDLVRRVARLVDLNEFKRRQVPFGIRVTPKAFGRDRRLPITNGYSEVAFGAP